MRGLMLLGTVLALLRGGCGPQPDLATAPLDLVITWWTDRWQSNVKAVPPNARALLSANATHPAADLSFTENFLDIAYALRSFERQGLLKHIRRVYVVMDENVLKTFGAPRTLDFGRGSQLKPELRLVTDADIGVKVHERSAKWSALHKIPGLSDWFLYSADDALLLNQFQMGDFWDAVAKKPRMASYGSWVEGWCNGGRTTGSFHGPVLVNKCWQKDVGQRYSRPQYAPYSWQSSQVQAVAPPASEVNRVMDSTTRMDALCLYSNAVVRDGLAIDGGYLPAWFFECHTNMGLCTIADVHSAASRGVRFVNFQGPGVSEEKIGATVSEAAVKQLLVGVAGPGPMSLEKKR